jgi:hypothetical protein
LILFSQANFCAFMFCVLHQVKYGHGKHLADVLAQGPEDLRMIMKVRLSLSSFFPWVSITPCTDSRPHSIGGYRNLFTSSPPVQSKSLLQSSSARYARPAVCAW